jgi:glycosyltransferase involved in cell wall biosynthesis
MQRRLTGGGSTSAVDRRLHVLFLNTRDRLGADVSVHLVLARALDRKETRVWAATSTYEAPGTSTRAALKSIPDLAVLPLDLGRPLLGQRGAARVTALLRNVRCGANLVRLAQVCRRQRVDLIHVTERPRDMLFGLLLARLVGCACVIHAHTGYYRHDANRFGNWLLSRADAVIGVSRFTADTYVRDAGLTAKRVFAVHNAVESDRFNPDTPRAVRNAMRARFAIPVDAPLIGCVARLSRWKDQATLIEALATVRQSVPTAHVVLAGETTDSAPDGQGDYKDYLMRRAAALCLDNAVTFAGFVPQHEMPGLYAALDVLAHPAVEEPFGLALVEAMASGRPVVAVGAGGVPEIIQNGVDGLLVSNAQPEALAAALVRVLCDQALAAQLARSARARVQTTFSPERQATEVLAVYRQVVAARAVRGHTARRRLSGTAVVQPPHWPPESRHDEANLIH